MRSIDQNYWEKKELMLLDNKKAFLKNINKLFISKSFLIIDLLSLAV